MPGRVSLESEVRKRLVCFGHAVHFLALLYRAATPFGSLEQLGRQALAHRFFAALASRFPQPAHRERNTPYRTDLDRHLEVRATYPAALHLDHRLRVRQRLSEDFQRILAAFLGDRLERAVYDALGDRLLAAAHEHVDELGDVARSEERRVGKECRSRWAASPTNE